MLSAQTPLWGRKVISFGCETPSGLTSWGRPWALRTGYCHDHPDAEAGVLGLKVPHGGEIARGTPHEASEGVHSSTPPCRWR